MIAIFNVIGSITMLIIDKKDDVQVLKSLGATNKLIRRIFLLEGMFVSIIGVVSGLVLGLIVCLLQLKFGLIKIGDGTSMVVSVYPIKLEILDFISTFLRFGLLRLSLLEALLSAPINFNPLIFS